MRDNGWVLDLRRLMSPSTNLAPIAMSSSALTQSCALTLPAPLALDWFQLYKYRAELDRRWSVSPYAVKGIEDKENAKVWEPRTRRLVGHTDRCVR
jgi:F-box and WD-40 domain protein 1/11